MPDYLLFPVQWLKTSGKQVWIGQNHSKCRTLGSLFAAAISNMGMPFPAIFHSLTGKITAMYGIVLV